MRSVIVAQTGTGASATTAVMDTFQNPFHVGIGVVVTGTVNYTVQHTFDSVLDAAVTPVWFNHPTLVSQAISADGNYAFPVQGIRVLVNSGTGTAKATVIQAGMPGR